jgi:hypothetical protein
MSKKQARSKNITQPMDSFMGNTIYSIITALKGLINIKLREDLLRSVCRIQGGMQPLYIYANLRVGVFDSTW